MILVAKCEKEISGLKERKIFHQSYNDRVIDAREKGSYIRELCATVLDVKMTSSRQRVFVLLTLIAAATSKAQQFDSVSPISTELRALGGEVISERWKLIWSSKSGLAIDTLTRDSMTLYQAIDIGVSESEDDSAAHDEGDPDPELRVEEYRMLSIAGSLVSFEKASYFSGGGAAHPSSSFEYSTLDLSSKTFPHLTDLFDSSTIFVSLMRNSRLREYLRKSNPSGLADLLANLEGGCKVDFAPLLTSYEIYDCSVDSVQVQLLLEASCEWERRSGGESPWFMIQLPMPPERRSSFMKAKSMQSLGIDLY